MVRLSIKKGLDIPLSDGPTGSIQPLQKPKKIALSLDPFEFIRFKIHVRVGDKIKIGQPLVESKPLPGRMFVSPASGNVAQIVRGLKRQLRAIVIELDQHEEYYSYPPIKLTSYDEICERFRQQGLFPHIQLRPFCLIADTKFKPRDIFIKCLESLPFVPSAEMQVEGHEDFFQAGLDTLARLTSGKVHLIHVNESSCKAFTQAKGVEIHSAKGPHPIANSSVHIHLLKPIRHAEDYVWSLSTLDVIVIGKMVLQGVYHIDRVISIGGGGIIKEKRGYFKARSGYPILGLIEERIPHHPLCFISGDPLTGGKVTQHDFLGFNHTAFTVLPEHTERESFHFLRMGIDKYSATRTYLSGFFNPPEKGYSFTTNQHGEVRPFIDGNVYNKVMPMKIATMPLIKAALAEDFELAELLGLLEVAPEDFALPSFICPSKIEMQEIIKKAIHRYANEMGF